ncbi:MAG: alpha-amylase family glycosyl hydrolase [Eubacteriales bacterium]|nr:alpha-amylase family glycosyl hydrolase [Eubacteriales bacterium]
MKRQRFAIKPGHALPFGVTRVQDGVQFAIYLPDRKQCFLKLYRLGAAEPEYRIPLTEEFRMGSVYFVLLELQDSGADTEVAGKRLQNTDHATLAQILTEQYEYLYEADGEDLVDPYASALSDRQKWGKREPNMPTRGRICLREFDWETDHPLHIDFSDLILYQLHMRGYTRHASSKVKHPGTFVGLQQKIPYLQDLGINGVLLLPIYEFQEIQTSAAAYQKPQEEGYTLNYWGYGAPETYYFAPKASYSSHPEQADQELKSLIKALHHAGIEVLMDFYFSPGTNLTLMIDCLRYWVLEYHVDGFRVNTEVMPSISLASDPILSGVKLLSAYWDPQMLSDAGVCHAENALAEYNDGFMNDARRFLKSDEGRVEPFFQRFYRMPKDAAVVNYITHVNGFTLMDLVSYDIKHNESNGENNMDGTEYNYSWNCGVEGKSRKKAVTSQRMRQIRNAFLMLLCSQGTPMILAGDEYGNTQEGNNNPYCHDDTVTWLNWRETKQKEQIHEYVKRLIAFRKSHPILHQGRQLQLMDTISCGVPDLSAHGLQTWRPDFSNYSRMLGVLLSGRYVQNEAGEPEDSLYIIFNMYWETKSFDLPTLSDGSEWHVFLETYDETFSELPPRKPKKAGRKRRKQLGIQRKTVVPPRSIVIFVSR